MKDQNCGYCMRGELLDEFGIFICDLDVSSLILFKEQSHPGRCIVAYKDHVSEIVNISDEDRNAFFADVNRAAKAIHAAFHPDKVNYGAYGDTGCHLHMHLVPKYKDQYEWGGVFQMNSGAQELAGQVTHMVRYWEDDEYSWIKFDDEVEDVQIDDEVEIPMIAADVVEAVAEAPVEQFEDEVQAVAVEETPAEEPVIAFAEVPSFEVPEEPIAEETPIEAPVEEAQAEVEIEIPMVAADILEETVVEAPVEETLAEEPTIDAPIIAEAPVEVPEEPFAEETPIEAVAEAPVEPVAVMTLPGIKDVEPIAGLEMEGSEPSSESAVSEGSAVVAEVETAVTGADVEPAPAATSRFNGLEEDGEGLPKLSDPVIKRPRSVRFRFSNGVLQNVESNDKVEPKEELRGPLA